MVKYVYIVLLNRVAFRAKSISASDYLQTTVEILRGTVIVRFTQYAIKMVF